MNAKKTLDWVVKDLKSKTAWGKTGQRPGIRQPETRGTPVLFAGSSGTGKTLAANMLAGELAMDIFRVDLSRVVSKYIGETEKNLAGIFDRAAKTGVVLFFDEADALFGKRSEVKDSHDRYANQETSYLLQRMEAFDGIVILAVNNKAVLDPKTLRYFKHVVEF